MFDTKDIRLFTPTQIARIYELNKLENIAKYIARSIVPVFSGSSEKLMLKTFGYNSNKNIKIIL